MTPNHSLKRTSDGALKSTIRWHLGKVRFPLYILLCTLPWLVAAYWAFFPRRLHPDAEYMFKLKIALLLALLVVTPGLLLAASDFARKTGLIAGLCALSAAGFLYWFPWEALVAILKP